MQSKIFLCSALLALAGCELSVDELATTSNQGAAGDAGAAVAPPGANANCVDNDGDGYGLGCVLGVDCNDFDRLVNPGQREYCDFVDNDCDGLIDENLGIGEDCVVELSTCAVDGTITCSAGGIPYCEPTESLTEVCNGLDDDCDGEVDDEVLAPDEDCATGLDGECAAGRLECVDGAFSCEPLQLPAAQDEICNGLDDDCDGDVDNLVGQPATEITRDCYQGAAGTDGVGVCFGGTQTCTGATLPYLSASVAA